MIRSKILPFAWLVAAWAIPMAGLVTIPPAHADTLTTAESAYVQQYGAAVCQALDKYHTISGVVGVVKGVVNSGFTAEQAVDVVNASVALYCDRNWALLQQTGTYFRNQAKGQSV